MKSKHKPLLLLGLEKSADYGMCATIEQGRYSYVVPWITEVRGEPGRGLTLLIDFEGTRYAVADKVTP
jgi:hypothetical protein